MMEMRARGGGTTPAGEEKLELDALRVVGPVRVPGAVVGVFAGVDDAGAPLVRLRGEPAPRPARRTVDLAGVDVGAQLLVVCEEDDATRPIVVGVLDASPMETRPRSAGSAPRQVVRVDGEQVVIEGEREVVLKCGAATLTLTRDGRIVVRGEEIVSRAAGRHKIKGAAVQIN